MGFPFSLETDWCVWTNSSGGSGTGGMTSGGDERVVDPGTMKRSFGNVSYIKKHSAQAAYHGHGATGTDSVITLCIR